VRHDPGPGGLRDRGRPIGRAVVDHDDEVDARDRRGGPDGRRHPGLFVLGRNDDGDAAHEVSGS
jgi:hypothetical protein